MIVKCIANRTSALPPEVRANVEKAVTREEYWEGLEIGKEYVVYGILNWDGAFGYALDMGNRQWPWRDYPMFAPASFFEILSNVVPPDFRVLYEDLGAAGVVGEVVFRAWAETPYFMDFLTDGDEAAQQEWYRAREAIDAFAELERASLNRGSDDKPFMPQDPHG